MSIYIYKIFVCLFLDIVDTLQRQTSHLEELMQEL